MLIRGVNLFYCSALFLSPPQTASKSLYVAFARRFKMPFTRTPAKAVHFGPRGFTASKKNPLFLQI